LKRGDLDLREVVPKGDAKKGEPYKKVFHGETKFRGREEPDCVKKIEYSFGTPEMAIKARISGRLRKGLTLKGAPAEKITFFKRVPWSVWRRGETGEARGGTETDQGKKKKGHRVKGTLTKRGTGALREAGK